MIKLLISILLIPFYIQAQLPGIFAASSNYRGQITPPIEGHTLGINEMIGIETGGQSNALGTNASTPSTSPIDYTAPITDVFIRTSGSTFATLDYPSNDKGDAVGSNLSMGYALRSAFNRPLYTDVTALSGAPIAAEDGRQDFNVSTGELYPTLSASMLIIQNAIIAQEREPYMILLWIQGERDTATPEMAAAWYDNFDDIVNQLIADGVSLDAVIVCYLNETLDVDPTNRSLVRNNQIQWVADHPGFGWGFDLNPYPLGADEIHYDGSEQEQIGIDLVDDLINGVIIDDIESLDIPFSEVLANMANTPPTQYQDAMQAFVEGCQSDGIWDDILEFQCRALDTEANGLRGWKGFYNATNVGATHIEKQGFDYDGTADNVHTGIIPSTTPSGIYSKNDGGIAVYVKDNQTATGIRAVFGISDPTPDRITMLQNSNITYRINSSGSGTYTTSTSFQDNTFYDTYRTASNLQALAINGTQVQTSNPASTNRPDIELYEGAINSSGTASNFFDGIISAIVIYKASTMNHTQLYNRVQQLMDDLAAINDYVPIPEAPTLSDTHTLVAATTGTGLQIGDLGGKVNFRVQGNYDRMQFNVVNSDNYAMISYDPTSPATWSIIGSPSPNDYSIDEINASHGLELYRLRLEGSDNLIKWRPFDTTGVSSPIVISNVIFRNAGFGGVLINQNISGYGYGKFTAEFLSFTGEGAERFYLGNTGSPNTKYRDTTRISHCYMDSSGREAVQLNNHKYVMVTNITSRRGGLEVSGGIGQRNCFQAQGVGAGYIRNSIFESTGAPAMIASTGLDIINNRITWGQTNRPIYLQDLVGNGYAYKNMGDDTVRIEDNDFICDGYTENHVFRIQEDDFIVVIRNNRFPPSATNIYTCDGPCPTIITSGNTFDSDEVPPVTFGPPPEAEYVGWHEVVTSDYDYNKGRGMRTPEP